MEKNTILLMFHNHETLIPTSTLKTMWSEPFLFKDNSVGVIPFFQDYLSGVYSDALDDYLGGIIQASWML